jgi:hypothetical protein
MSDKLNRKELLLEQVDRLRQIKLPPEWEVAKLEVKFRRNGVMEDSAYVIYDSLNGNFYVKNDYGYIHPKMKKVVAESIEIMDRANSIIGAKTKV